MTRIRIKIGIEIKNFCWISIKIEKNWHYPIITQEAKNLKHIHTTIRSQYLSSRKNNKASNNIPHDIHSSEQTFACHMRKKMSQLRANKSPLLQSNIHTVNPKTYMPQCSLNLSHTHNTNHLFNCSQVPTQHHKSVKIAFRSSRDNPRVGI